MWIAKASPFQASQPRTFLYVNNNDFENSVSAFSVGSDGRLQPLQGSPFPTGGIGGRIPNIDAIAVSKKTSQLFVTNNRDNTLTGFQIGSDGRLTRFPSPPLFTGGTNPSGVAVNKKGSLVFVANMGSDSIASFSVTPTGSIRPVNGSPFLSGNGPVSLVTNKNSTLLFASHHFSTSVGAYQIGSDGRVTFLESYQTLGSGQQGVALQRSSSSLYVASMTSSSISAFKADLNNGQLRLVNGSPFFTNGSRPLDVVAHPKGNFVYVCNNNTSTISVFSVAADGSLRQISGSPFNTDGIAPAAMAINSAGTLLFVVNGGFGGSKDVSVYRIDSSGRISPVAGSPFTTGSIGVPASITLLELS
ncbi:MAG: beta-propeller fold lactonase family protein [Blastocatellia bacterium]|nr:beta-propeller fold lactonase family protein [Blastocatellia bacterium]